MRGALVLAVLVAGCALPSEPLPDGTVLGHAVVQQYRASSLVQLRFATVGSEGDYEDTLRREASATSDVVNDTLSLRLDDGTMRRFEDLPFAIGPSGLHEARIPLAGFSECAFEGGRLRGNETERPRWGCGAGRAWAVRLADLEGYEGRATFNATLWEAVEGKVAETNSLAQNANGTMRAVEGVTWESWELRDRGRVLTGPAPERVGPATHRFEVHSSGAVRLTMDGFRFRATLPDGETLTHARVDLTLT